MKRDDFIKQCRYYNGESVSPWSKMRDDDEARNKDMLWWYESIWVQEMENGQQSLYDEMVSEFVAHGLSELGAGDGVPITLKALLFNRYGKTGWNAAKEFTQFYNVYYPNRWSIEEKEYVL